MGATVLSMSMSLDGFIADTASPSRGWLEDYIHPDDQPLVRAAIDEDADRILAWVRSLPPR